ncbi:MAG: ATP-dependent RecD-like DNA helicase [Solirubrobacterales bacterium]
MTTLAVRAAEQAIERRFSELASGAGRDVGDAARAIAGEQVAERIGAHLGKEQAHALALITGPERAAVLVGPAGTGKGVVIDAAARAEQLVGNRTFGIAVSGSTAQRLGHDSPALAGATLTLDALTVRAQIGRLAVDEHTTIYFDEAGMADTERLGKLSELVAQSGAKLIAIGDGAQLPSIGAGGMFERLSELVPSAALSKVRRTLDPAEQRAWADLRAGRSERAMAYYHSRGRLHMADTRDEALEYAVQSWAALTEEHPIEQFALISDASNQEIHRLNARAQHYRAERGELGELEVEVPGVHYGLREGDRVALIEQHRQPGRPRIENGERGEVLGLSKMGELRVRFDVTGRRRTFASEELAKLRLGYAHHIHRAQGATVTRTLVLTGGWQTSKEPAYVEASRARGGTDWFVSREDLGVEGHDAERIKRLAHGMRQSRAQMPSLAYSEIADVEHGLGLAQTLAPSHGRLLGRARGLLRLAEPPTHERAR